MTPGAAMIMDALWRWRLAVALAAATLGSGLACGRPRSAEASGDVAVIRGSSLPREIAADSTLREADAAIRAGHPWSATLLLAPLLRAAEPGSSQPAAVLLAARAAAGWKGWPEVDRLLSGEGWIDTRYKGEARELLARAALARGDDTTAAADARAAASRAQDARTRAVRFALRARALDRENQLDSARAAYAGAAAGLGEARDWLLLRAAGVDVDSTDRARIYAVVRGSVARTRIPWTEAEALERSGDVADAAVRYAALGAIVPSLRLRLSIPSDQPSHDRLRSELLGLIHARSGTGDARLAVELLDKYFPSLTPAEDLVVGRSAAASGPLTRAIAAYSGALAGAAAAPEDRLAYGELLARAGRYQSAIAEFDSVPESAPVAGEAAYQRARALLSNGNAEQARTELSAVASRFAADTAAAVPALYLLADLDTDDGRDADARSLLLRIVSDYPTSARADDARFRAGIISYAMGDYRGAARELDSLLKMHPSSGSASAARYWSGRALAAAGDSVTARARWREISVREPLSYYAAASARRLGETPWAPPPSSHYFPRSAVVEDAMRRIAVLQLLGMDAEAHFEEDALERRADASVDLLLTTAAAFREHGQPSHAIRLASRALDRGAARDARLFRLLYPLLDRQALVRQATLHHLDPAVVAGLIRQESSFNPRAVSVAGARGLMQVMPSVGQQIAHNLGFPVWEQALLFDPDANLQLGTAHLAGSVKQFGALVRVLAAYNAGASRALRWSSKTGADDPDLYAERISFTETRDYVRNVERNADMYRALYGPSLTGER